MILFSFPFVIFMLEWSCNYIMIYLQIRVFDCVELKSICVEFNPPKGLPKASPLLIRVSRVRAPEGVPNKADTIRYLLFSFV